ncbi:MAG: transporter [Bacillota bacterium]|jgi:predicted permease|nr:transporter [Bacillota bacterium]
MIINTLINSIILMGCLILIGFYLRKYNKLNDDAEQSFTYILVNITTPAMIINTFLIEFSLEKFQTGIYILIIAVVFDFILVLLAKFSAHKIKDDEKKRVLKYSLVMMNGGFMGFPIINQLFGQEGLFYATMFYIPNLVFMWTYGLSVFIREKKGNASYKKMLLNPNMISIYVGFAIYLLQIPLPAFGKSLVSLLASMTTVISMIIIGSKIKVIGVRESFSDKDAYYVSFLRLIVSSIIMIILLKFINVNDMIKQIYVIYAALPVAVMMPIVAKQYNRDDVFSSKIIVITHLLSLITIPIIVWLQMII